MSAEKRKFLTKRDGLLLAGILFLIGVLFCFVALSPPGKVAVVEHNGKVLCSRTLSLLTNPEELTFTGEGNVEVTVTFYPDGGAIRQSQCPDQICVKTGKLTREGEMAVCLPAKISLRLVGAATDAATY